jgi:sporulation protein YlmC with PRC-barrel domain
MKIRLQELLGREVHDVDGKRVGRIESVHAKIDGDECLITEYHLGPAALIARLGLPGARLLGIPHHSNPLRVPWDQIDVSNPRDVRLLCKKDELGSRR